MRRYRTCAAAALAAVALVLAGCSDDKPDAEASSAPSPTAARDVPRTAAEQQYQAGLDLVFPDEDVDDMIAIGQQVCTYVRERGGVAPDDIAAMVKISGDLAQATGNRFNETQYGFIVGLASTTLCADVQTPGRASGA
ncbi:hypothetical protein GS504_01555 [Rhodococcus hoagii]|nr:hypothetical protein [Prescottella equi]NKS71641.1 hypothetical protein [Prescottella equi]